MKGLNKYIALASLTAAIVACSDDDQTGDSTLSPASSAITVGIEHPVATVLEQDTTFTFTVTLNTPQIVDVAVYINVTAGDATPGDDFTYTSKVVIPANRTSASGSVTILADDLPEETETFEITIGDGQTENASITPTKMSYTIQNASSGDLPIALTWNGTLFDGSGAQIDPDDIANLTLLITKLDGTVVKTINTATYEEFVFNDVNIADGEYLVKVGIAGAINPGGLGTLPMLDLELEYSQSGVSTSEVLEFPAAFNPDLVCAGNKYTLAKIVKTDDTYEVTRVGEAAPAKDLSAFVGAYTANEPGYGDYDVNFTIGSTTDVLVIDNFWDNKVSIRYVSNVCVADGVIEIPAQSFGTYTVTGSGTYAGDEIIVEYTVVTTATGAVVDHNTHTFTKK